MKTMIRERFRPALFFAAWMAVVALRSIFARPYELLWFTGVIAAFACAFACGYVWRGLKPARDRRRANKRV